MATTWVLVADRARARLFELAAGAKALEEVRQFTNAEGDVRGLLTDRPPSAHDRFGATSHAIEPRTTEEEKSAMHFAAELNGVLEHGRDEHSYHDLVLIAPPRFLGALNAALDKQVHACVVSEVPKDLTAADTQTVYGELPASILRGAKGRKH